MFCLPSIDAAKRYHEYLVRLEKTELPEAKDARLKAARIKQRRIRVCFDIKDLIFVHKIPFSSCMKDDACKQEEKRWTSCSN